MKNQSILILFLGLMIFLAAPLLSWNPVRRLTWNTGNSVNPAVAVNSAKNIHIVWADDVSGNSEIYYRKSLDSGATWSAIKRLTWNTDASYSACIATSTINTNVFISVAWINIIQGNIDLFHKSSTMNGSTWGSTERLTWTTNIDYSPAIAFEQNALGLNVLWYAWMSSSNEIFYKRNH